MNGVFSIKYMIFLCTYYLHIAKKKIKSYDLKNRLYISFGTDMESKK